MSLAPLLIPIPIAMLVTAAAYTDYRARRIPNIIPVLLIAFFGMASLTGLTGLTGLTDAGGAQIITFTVSLSIGAGLFFGGFWGAGDAKLLAAISLYLDPAQLIRLILVACLAGGILAFGLLIRWRNSPEKPSETRPTVPFGIALAVGTLEWALHPLILG